MHEPFHTYHARRQLERDTAIPVLDVPAERVRLRRSHRPFRAPAATLTLGLATACALLIERFAA